jgi:hypothetical protein
MSGYPCSVEVFAGYFTFFDEDCQSYEYVDCVAAVYIIVFCAVSAAAKL